MVVKFVYLDWVIFPENQKSSAESGRVGSSAELYEEANIFKLHIFGVEITNCSFLHIGKSNLRIKEWDYVRKISMRR